MLRHTGDKLQYANMNCPYRRWDHKIQKKSDDQITYETIYTADGIHTSEKMKNIVNSKLIYYCMVFFLVNNILLVKHVKFWYSNTKERNCNIV